MQLPSAFRASTLRGLLAYPFVRQVSETYLTRFLIVVLGLVNSILVTRILGPEGRGMFAVAVTIAAIGVQLGNLGLHSSNTYYVARDPQALPTLLGNSLLVSAACAVVTVVAFAVVRTNPGLAPLGGPLLALALAAIPVGLASLLLQNLLIGTLQIHAYNVIDFVTRILGVLLVGATVPMGVVSPEVVFALGLATTGLGAVWIFVRLRSIVGGPIRRSTSSLWSGLQYGLRAYFGSLFAFLVLKSDVVLVKYLRGAEETGYYSIAVGIADLLLMLPTVLGTILLPRLGAAPGLAHRWDLTRRVLKVVVPGTPLALLVVLLTARPLIRLAYGSAFDPAFSAVVWLLPGIGFLAINTVLMNFFAACGMPPVTVYSPLIALVVNVLINLRLIPSLGFVGASVSSSLAYGLMLLMSLVYLRFGGQSRDG